MFGVVVGLVTKSRSTLVTPWTVACQPPLSMEFSRQENWSRLPFPSPGDLPDPRIEPRSPALQADFFFPTELREKPMFGASITILGLDSWGLAECLCHRVSLQSETLPDASWAAWPGLGGLRRGRTIVLIPENFNSEGWRPRTPAILWGHLFKIQTVESSKGWTQNGSRFVCMAFSRSTWE